MRDAALEFMSSCEQLGVPLARDINEGSATQLTYLGIELDTVN